MAVLSGNASPIASQPVFRAFRWCGEALRIWGRAPFKLWVLCLGQLGIESALQLLIPWAGMVLSKIIVPMLIMGILIGLHGVSQGRRMRWTCLFAAFRRRRLGQAWLLAALTGLMVFAVQQMVAWAVYGWPAVDATLFGHALAHRQLLTPAFERILILPGVLPSILLLLSPCLFLFEGSSPWQAVCRSVRIVLHHGVSFGMLLLVNLGLFALIFANPWAFFLVVFFLPWSVALTYAVWRDLCAHARPQAVVDRC